MTSSNGPPPAPSKLPGDQGWSLWRTDRFVGYAAMLFLAAVAALIATSFGFERCITGGETAPVGCDFFAIWSATDLLADQNAAAVYQQATLFFHQQTLFPPIAAYLPWLYPPHLLWLLAPLGYLPYSWAWLVYTVAGLLIYGLALRVVVGDNRAIWPALAFPAALVTAVYGQTGFLTAGLAGLALVMLRQRPWSAGVLVGLLTVKPQLGLLFPLVLIVGGHWRCFLAAALTTLALIGISLWSFGPQVLVWWLEALRDVGDVTLAGDGPAALMTGVLPHLLRAEFPSWLAWAMHLSVAIPVTLITLWLWRLRIPQNLKYAALTSATLIVSPYVLWYDLIWWALPMGFLVADARHGGWRKAERPLLLLLALYPLAFPFLTPYPQWLVTPAAMLLLFALVVSRSLRVIAHANRAKEAAAWI